MAIYAILDKNTNIVKNVIHIEDERYLFLDSDERGVPATRATQIGMSYDESTKTFPEAVEKDKILDLRDEFNSIVDRITKFLTENPDLSTQDRKVYTDCLTELSDIGSFETQSYSDIKSKLDSIQLPPSI